MFWLSGVPQRAAEGIFISILKDSRSRLRALHVLTLPFQAIAMVTACSALVEKVYIEINFYVGERQPLASPCRIWDLCFSKPLVVQKHGGIRP